MGLFGKKKDWNVIAVMFETKGKYRVNGNRSKASAAEKVRDGAKGHDRTLVWAVFDQKRGYVEGGPGPNGPVLVPRETLNKLVRELHTLETVRAVLSTLEEGKTDKVSLELKWTGYPRGD